MKTKKKEALAFEKLYTVRGLYEDGKGNEFYIYVSGEKKEVDKFIRYQKRKLVNDEFGIRVIVTPNSSVEAHHLVEENEPKRNKKPVEFKSGKVKIGISRHKIVAKRPYEITYHIDPKIKTPPETVTLGQKLDPVPDFEFEFDGLTSDVTCTVQMGKVEFTLIEVDRGLADGPKTVDVEVTPPPNNSVQLVAVSKGTMQKWRIEAIGKRPGKESVFNLEYTKKFA